MSWLRFWRREQWDKERARELEAHLEIETQENIARGMTPEEARYAARRKLGNVTLIREEIRRMNTLGFLETLWQDVRYAARMLAKNPGFTIVAVLTLALGIGANTAIFSVVNAVLLRPLAFPGSDRLVIVWGTQMAKGVSEDVVSYPAFEDWRAQSKSLEGVAAFTTRGATLSGGDRAEHVAAIQASAGFFEMLGVLPAMGRTIRSEDQEAGTSRVVLLSHAFWQRRFAGRKEVLGETLRVNEEPYTIIGVMPGGFEVPPGRAEEIYTPMVRDPDRGHGFLMVMARLRANVSLSAAQAEMNVITRRLAAQYPKYDGGTGANVMSLTNAWAGTARAGLLIFLGVVSLVLLIACANVANLMLARSAARQKELAVRAALGAGRARLAQQLLVESGLLALAGGTVGLVFANWGTRGLVAEIARNFSVPRLENSHTDGWVFWFTLALALFTGLLFGLAPALGAATPNLNNELRESGRTATGGVRGGRLRSVLVIAETAMALVLLAGAGLLLKSLVVLRSTAPGFQTANLLTVDFSLPRIKFASSLERLRYFRVALTRVQAQPGVLSSALVANLPMGGGSDGLGFHIPGRPDPRPGDSFQANFNIASSGYFRTMGIPIRAGREFGEQDGAATQPVVVINETAARTFWPGENPLGREISLPGPNNTSTILSVVGVAGDVRQASLGIVPKPEIFLNYMQPGPPWPWLVLVARTKGDPLQLAGTVKEAAQSVDPDVPILQVRSMDDVLSESLAQPGLYTWLLGVFAALALALAAVGLYGVVSYSVQQRTHEMGIRTALGAGPNDILRMVLSQGLGLTIAGAAIGMVGALAVARLLIHLVPSARTGDPLTLLCVTGLLMCVALAACYVPARRAMRVDPMVALRYE
jgi:putative ABC transport system permease protein